MKDFGGLKKSYYMDPQPSSNYEWHLFEYEINDSNTLALYRLEFKASDPKRSVKSKLGSSSLNEIQQQMVKLSANSPVDNKRGARSKTKATQKDTNVNTYPALKATNQAGASNAYETVPLNIPNQASASNAYQTVAPSIPNQDSTSNAYEDASQVDPMSFLNDNVVYGPHLPYGYPDGKSDFYWNPSSGTWRSICQAHAL